MEYHTENQPLTGGLRTKGELKTSASDAPLISVVTVVRNRPVDLQVTIDSVRRQTFSNIEHIIVDGASDDGTVDVIKSNESTIDYFISEKDDGIYAAINKGIGLSKGDYICILHAGDTYEPTFIERSLSLITNDPDEIVYSSYYHGAKESIANEINDGIYFHYLNINHSTFLVHRDCYAKVGPYNERNRINSDAIWIRKAYAEQAKFKRLPETLFRFAEGGASSGNSEDARNRIISEHVKAYQIHFPALPSDVCRAIYLSRFDDTHLDPVHRYLVSIRTVDKTALTCHAELLGALRHMYAFVWQGRPLKFELEKHRTAARLRFKVANALGNRSLPVNVRHGECGIDQLATAARKIRQANTKNKKTLLHFLQVFSRPTETFVYDLLKGLDFRGEWFSVVLCDQRLLADERPYSNCLEFHHGDYEPEFSDQVTRTIMAELGPSAIVCHFAINGWHLFRRLDEDYKRLPTVFMTHGIDVFTIPTDKAYGDFILKDARYRPNLVFTAVTNYLKQTLKSCGVPEGKIKLVCNSAHERFLLHRKRTPYHSGDPIRILNVGRLVGWKGQQHLLKAVHILKAEHHIECRLTLVVGGEKRSLPQTLALIEELGIGELVEIVDFVDFEIQPNFYTNFDVFVSSSTYEGKGIPRSETFGVSTLEAIYAGLPVVATDAGGTPEVVGHNSRHSRIVPNGSATAIAEAIRDMHASGDLQEDNLKYAQERRTLFSQDNQISGLDNAISAAGARRTKVAIFSTHVHAGAGAAAVRLHRSLLKANIESRLIHITNKLNEDLTNSTTITAPNFDFFESFQPQGHRIRRDYTIFTLDFEVLSNQQIADLVHDCDVINLHWYARMLSVENINFLASLGKPVVFTIRDMFPLTGGCHYFHGCEKWKLSCQACPQLLHDRRGVPSTILARKIGSWSRENISVVTLSNHTAEIVRQSPVFSGCKLSVIPNGIHIDVFYPRAPSGLAEKYGLDPSKKTLFYLPSYGSLAKGQAELKEALSILSASDRLKSFQLLLAGAADNALDNLNIDIKKIGFVKDKEDLAHIYSVADITLVPSLEETFSNTTAESIACGVPVVGFKVGAIADMASEGRGISVDVGDVAAYARAILEVASWDKGRTAAACNEYARRVLDNALQGQRYSALFDELLAKPLNYITETLPAAAQKSPQNASRYVLDFLEDGKDSATDKIIAGGDVFGKNWHPRQHANGRWIRWCGPSGLSTLKLPLDASLRGARECMMMIGFQRATEGAQPRLKTKVNGTVTQHSVVAVQGRQFLSIKLGKAVLGSACIDLDIVVENENRANRDRAIGVFAVSLIATDQVRHGSSTVSHYRRTGVLV